MKSGSTRPKQTAAKSAGRASADKKPAGAAKKASSSKQQAEPHGTEDLKKLFEDILKDTMSAEKQLVKALPKMAKGASSEELKAAFTDHLQVTQGQVTRLEQVFEVCGLKVGSKKCEAMEGLVKEGEEAIEDTEDGSAVRDVALIVAAQKVEHYEIAAYGSLRNLATILGYDEAADLLQETLDEEGDADKTLTGIAEEINVEAYAGGDEEEEDEDDEDEDEDDTDEDGEDEKPAKGGRSGR